MANLVQRKMGDALGYRCTMLTRKDKYLILAGNDGIIRSTGHKSAPSAAAAAAAAETGRKNKSTQKNN
jgi:glycerol-3-phosphate acyltransferase